MTMPAGAVARDAAGAERDAGERERAQPSGGGGGFFSRKYGPLKGWQWSLAAGGAALAYFWWRSRSRAQATTGTAVTGTAAGVSGQLAALQDEIDALQGASAVTATGPAGGTGGGGTGGDHDHHHRPGKPTSPHVERVGIYTATVAWDPPRDADGHVTGYDVERSGARSVYTARHRHSFSGLKPGTHYTWKVRSVSAAGKSDWAGGSFTTKHREDHDRRRDGDHV